MKGIKATKTTDKDMDIAKLVQVAADVELLAVSISARCIEVYISWHVFATRWLQIEQDETEALLWKSLKST